MQATKQVGAAEAARGAPQQAPPPGAVFAAWQRQQRRQRLAVGAGQLLLLVLLLVLWELSARLHWANPLLTSKPSTVAKTLLQLLGNGDLVKHTWVTLQETLVSFIAGMLIALVLAIAVWWSEFLSRLLDPYFVVLNALPKIALGPIFYVWLGDRLSIYGMAIGIALVTGVIMLHAGFAQVDREKIKLLRTLGASKWQTLWKVVMPASTPTLVATAKVALSLTLVGVIVGEFLSSKAGLGYMIIYGSQIFRMDLVMTSVVILAILSALLYLAMQYIERLALHRQQHH